MTRILLIRHAAVHSGVTENMNPRQTATRLVFTMPKLTRQTNESNFHEVYTRILPHAVSGLSACDVKPATTERHLLMTRFAEYRKNTAKWA